MRERYIYHRIEPGDTMKSIANKYGITTYALTRKNPGIVGDRSLKVGEFLIIGVLNNDSQNGSENGSENAGQNTGASKDEQDDGEDGSQDGEDEEQIVLPERWLTDAEIQEMALEQVRDNSNQLKQLAAAKNRAVEKLNEQAKRDELSYGNTVDALYKQNESDKKDFLQEAIQKGIGRSSIVKSTNNEYDRQRDEAMTAAEQKKLLDDAERTNAMNDVLRSYNLDVADANQKYQQKYDQAVNSIKEKNQDANLNVAIANGGVSHTASYDMADKLLGTLSKKQAGDYLERNKDGLIGIWGDEAYQKLLKKYK